MAYDQQLADALAENAELRRWKAMEKPLTAAMAVVASDVQKLRAENERLRAMVEDACQVFDHYDLPEHAFHYRREIKRTLEQNASGEVT